jgi:tyrosine-protein kinase Etk/Wzc
MKPAFIQHKKKETFNLKKELFRYTRNWKWFLLCVILFVTLAFFSARYNPVVYETTARIKIINQKQNEIELPGNLNSLFDDFKVNQENEIEIIKSYRILERVVESLELNIRYYTVNKIKTEQVWELPFKAFAKDSLSSLPKTGAFFIDFLEEGYLITDVNLKQWNIPYHQMDSVTKDLPFLLKLDDTKGLSNTINKKFKVRFFNKKEATLRLLSGLRIEQIGKYSEVLKISFRNESSAKSEAILNEVIEQFNQDGIKDRKLIFQRTIDFVDERFEYLVKELDSIESLKEIFKENNNLTDIGLDTEHNLSDKSNSNAAKVNLETQLEVARILKKSLINKKNFKLLPANVGVGITGINDQIILYNKKVLDFGKLRISGGANNPVVINLKRNINSLRQSILTSVIAYQRKSETALANIKNVDVKNKGFFRALPKKEKVLRGIEREQSIKENLFVFLLQRREEAAINLVITAPTVKVVDYAITNLIPVSGNPKMLYVQAFVGGILVPFIFFYLLFFVDTRIQTKEDIYANVNNTKVLGTVPFSFRNKIFNGLNDNSLLAEDFRMLRTNINFKLKEQAIKNVASILMVTSTKSKEGKTFCAVNLAIAYATLGKKVLLIEADFRNPQIASYLKNESEKGFTNYLKGDEFNFRNLITKNTLGETNFDVLFSGKIPSAPAELLANGKLEYFISSVEKEYDYIIFDTAPTLLYTDTLLISDFADEIIYVTRSAFTNKKDLVYSEELIESEKLKNVSYILNYQETHSLLKNIKLRK